MYLECRTDDCDGFAEESVRNTTAQSPHIFDYFIGKFSCSFFSSKIPK